MSQGPVDNYATCHLQEAVAGLLGPLIKSGGHAAASQQKGVETCQNPHQFEQVIGDARSQSEQVNGGPFLLVLQRAGPSASFTTRPAASRARRIQSELVNRSSIVIAHHGGRGSVTTAQHTALVVLIVL